MSRYLLSILLFISVLFITGCGSDDEDDYKKDPVHTNVKGLHKSHQKYNYSIYVENSGSLNGYLASINDSGFKPNVFAFISTIATAANKHSLSIYDVNTKIIPAAVNANGESVSKYLSHLDAQTFEQRSRKNKGDQSKSDLQHVFKQVLDTMGLNEVAVLITDGIFSPGKTGNANNYLDEQQAGLTMLVDEKLNRYPFSTLVLQFSADFKGRYYYQDNSSKDGFFEKRPYYIICFGNENALQRLLQQIQLQTGKYNGFRNFMLLTDARIYNVLPHVTNGKCYDFDADKPMTVTGIRSDERDNKFRIKVDVDLAALPVSESYLQDHNNYAISKGYSIETVAPSDRKGYTHRIVLVANKPQTGRITIALNNNIPAWIETCSLSEDTGLSPEALQGKTFGLKYLLGGLYEAYYQHAESQPYFTFTISVKE